MQSDADSASIAKLIAKIAEQAKELSALNRARLDADVVNNSQQSRIEELEGQLKLLETNQLAQSSSSQFSSSLSGAALQRRLERQQKEQLDSLHKLLDTSEQRVVESNKIIAKLTQELENSNRTIKQFEKKCNEFNRENQKLRVQLESSVKVTASGRTGSLAKSLSMRNGKVLSDELIVSKGENDKMLKELDMLREQVYQLQLDNRVLHDALEFRSDEIGLSGHTDLLARVAALRGEVTALRSELGAKKDQLSTAEADRTDLSTKQESLLRQISLMQQRVTQSQEDLKRLSLGDLPTRLTSLQQERDVLLDYIEGDMSKSTVLAKQMEQLNSEIRVLEFKYKSAEERATRAENALEVELAKYREMDMTANSLHLKVAELSRIVDVLKEDKIVLQGTIAKKTQEAEEFSRLHIALINESKEKESEIRNLEHNSRVSNAKVHELELNSTALINDNNSLRQRLQQREDELGVAQRGINSIEPRVAQLEPEVMLLRKEREDWMQERVKLQSELNELRLVDAALGDLTKDLSAIKLANGNGVSTAFHVIASMTDHGDNSANNHLGDNQSFLQKRNAEKLSLSRQHAGWIGLPTLRTLSPELYEFIRKLAADLSRKEGECDELISAIAVLKADVDATTLYHSNNQLRLLQSSDLADKALGEARNRLLEIETELTRTRNAKTILDQLRMIMLSFPGGQEIFVESNSGLPFSESQRGGLKSGIMPDDTVTKKAKFEEELRQAPDQMLPELIGRALMYNANAVVTLQETRANFESAKLELLQVQMQNANLEAENNELSRLCQHYSEATKGQEDSFYKIEEDLRKELDSAVELAEKQNALTITLESKLEGVKRERQLKSAQLTSLQQREDAMAMRLTTTLKEAAKRCGFQLPDIASEGARLPEIIQQVGDTFARLIQMNLVGDTRQQQYHHQNRYQQGSSENHFRPNFLDSHVSPDSKHSFDTSASPSAQQTTSQLPMSQMDTHNTTVGNNDNQAVDGRDNGSHHFSSSRIHHQRFARSTLQDADRIQSSPSWMDTRLGDTGAYSMKYSRDNESQGHRHLYQDSSHPHRTPVSNSNSNHHLLHAASGTRGIGSASASGSRDDPMTPSRILQSRLKKAQQAFASMREPF